MTYLPPRSALDMVCHAGTQVGTIVTALESQGWIAIDDFLDEAQWRPLATRARSIRDYRHAGVGRGDQLRLTPAIRRDRIYWLDDSETADRHWLALMEQLRLRINRELYLGLFEYESHFAYYPPGAYYRRHLDAFKGQGNRRVSTVLYLNDGWQPAHGGELMLYPADRPDGVSIPPRAGTLVVFLSEDMPHEVLETQRERYSIAGWFRVNGSDSVRLDTAL